ncbi:MAG: hypothetical protein ACLFUS_10790 [Candidatus Sumerlaeia bacterium]
MNGLIEEIYKNRLVRLFGIGVLAFLAFLPTRTEACSVPVFRYALERWEPDFYEAYIFYRDGLEGDSALLDLLNNKDKSAPPVNLRLIMTDVDGEMDERTRKIWDTTQKAEKMPDLPAIAVFLPPRMRMDAPITVEPLTRENVERILQSPAREEISRRIRGGHSAVFLMVEGAEAEMNESAEAALTSSFDWAQKNLQLATEMVDEQGLPFQADPNTPEIKIHFSRLRMQKNDPRETYLMDNFYAMDPELREKTEPMVFTFFGQGRAVYPFIGDEITSDNLNMACAFLAGDCSCVIKDQNPGMDMLFQTDWWDLASGSVVENEPLPPLRGYTGFAAANTQRVNQEAGTASEDTASTTSSLGDTNFAGPEDTSSGLMKKILLVCLALGLILIVGFSVWLHKRGSTN